MYIEQLHETVAQNFIEFSYSHLAVPTTHPGGTHYPPLRYPLPTLLVCLNPLLLSSTSSVDFFRRIDDFVLLQSSSLFVLGVVDVHR